MGNSPGEKSSKKTRQTAKLVAPLVSPTIDNPPESPSSSKPINMEESQIKRKRGRPSKAAMEARKVLTPKSTRCLRSNNSIGMTETSSAKPTKKRSSATSGKRSAKVIKKQIAKEKPLTTVSTSSNGVVVEDTTTDYATTATMKQKRQGLNASAKQQPELMPTEKDELKFYYL